MVIMRKKLLLSLFVLLTAAFGFTQLGVVDAEELASPEVETTEQQTKTTTVVGNVYQADETVNIEGPIDGNVYAAGGTITLTGVVEKDVNLAGEDITISNADIKGDVRVFGAEVTIINSSIGDEAFIGSGSASIDKESVINGTLFVGTGDISLHADVKEDAFLGIGAGTVSSTISGTLILGGGSVTFKDGASLNNLTIVEGTSYTTEGEVLISGEEKTIQRSFIFTEEKPSTVDRALRYFFEFAGFLLLALLLSYYFPSQVVAVANKVKNNPWKSTFVGIGIFAVVLILTIPLLLSRMGLPLMSAITVLLFSGIYVGRLFVSQVIGSYILPKNDRFNDKQRLLLQVTIGYVIIFVLKSIPIFGLLVSSFVATIGLGALLLKLKAFTDANKNYNQGTNTENNQQ